MTKRQYLLQHLLHLSAMLSETTNPQQRKNMETAILFYAKELRELDSKHNTPPFTQ